MILYVMQKKRKLPKAAPDANETAYSVVQRIIRKTEAVPIPAKEKKGAAKRV